MSLASRIDDLAAAVRDKLNLMSARLLPTGGTAGQVVTKTGPAVADVAWATPSVGGGGSQEVFVQTTRPVGNGPWTWWKTNTAGDVIDLIIADGNA